MTHPPSLVFIALIPLLIWRIYSRIKRNLGPQKSVLWRHILVMTIYTALLSFFVFHAIHQQQIADAVDLLVGLFIGLTLAFVGLKKTKFTRKDGEFYYTPNAHIGIALTIILVGRMLYRFYQLYFGNLSQTSPAQIPLTSTTLFILSIFFSYYLSYTFGVLRARYSKEVLETD